ncbi:very long chain fatty acid elongase 4-like isoform X1 [Parasteatoda tepidariorum]|uniref:very long chain fatty acid elongase 4-like isoform X1 n=1 Tax=Parasteatoda tepidariorum TaxID=114398 RepID=UPI00077FD376|nr:elongation of very long chain fatty acids protein 4-like isoform X1 [Parasteatoda tepidariorum]XP_021000465.1 elongation of very long chain fatty acids protein 4-like isoform X1 [Parasteatoda tepidariorum]
MSEKPAMAHMISEKYDAVQHFLFSSEADYADRIGRIHYPLAIISAYLLIVKVLGPLIMKPLKPFKLNGLLIAFNVTIVLWNAYLSFSFFRHLYDVVKEGRLCSVNASTDEYSNNMYRIIWSYYMSKYVDLLDTCFFVLRKKQRQVSFLHVFHHSSIIIIAWGVIGTKSAAHYSCVAAGLNSFVHVCTYSYYALSACGDKMQDIINSKKKYLTFLQVLQFWIILAYIMWSKLSGCEVINAWNMVIIVFLFILMLLFADFYSKNYRKKKE